MTIGTVTRVACVPFAALLLGCFPDPTLDQETLSELSRLVENAPPEHAEGKAVFESVCVACHGTMAQGVPELGPPLAHPVYRPSHHADAAFTLAIQRGVRAHHWRFGDMPAVPGISPESAEQIVAYLRWLQRGVGID